MSAVITQMVLRRRAAKIDAEANQRAYESVVAAAKGDKGDKGDKGEPGRGISKVEVKDGEIIVIYTDKSASSQVSCDQKLSLLVVADLQLFNKQGVRRRV